MSSVNAVSTGEMLYLDCVRQQTKSALWESLGATEEITNNFESSASNEMSKNPVFPDANLSGYHLSPVDANGDGEVSEDEFSKSYSEAQNILAEIDAYQVRMRAYQARMTEGVDFYSEELVVNE